LRKAFDSGVGLNDEDLSLLESCMAAMENVSRHLDEDTGFFVANSALLDRIAKADAAIDRRIATDETGNNQQVATIVDARAAPTQPEPESEAIAAEYDPEIASVFSEEATELLEESQSSFQGISLTAPRREEFAALKRPLHTLKGGARMAGVMAMGDLAH